MNKRFLRRQPGSPVRAVAPGGIVMSGQCLVLAVFDVRPVSESDLEAFRRLHNRYVDRDASPATVRDWYRAHPDLLVGAYRDGGLVGHCLGRPWDEATVEVAGVSVVPDRRREGVGTALLAALEERAAASGLDRVTLASAGGYVDEFYLRNGYAPESVLVRLDPDDLPERDPGYDVVEETTDGDVVKLYVDADGHDPAFLEAVRDAYGDPEAIYVMSKRLDCS